MRYWNKQPRSCLYCARGTQLEDGTVLCVKKGLRQGDDPCRRFRYDPLKRIPPKPKALDPDRYGEEDFSL